MRNYDQVEFQTDKVGKVKLFYKNGSTYTVNGVNEFVVMRRISGGCDVEYSKIVEVPEAFGDRTEISVFSTNTQDVVAFEASNVTVLGLTFSKIYQRLK